MKIGKYKIELKNKDFLALLLMYGWATWYFFTSNKLGNHEQTMAFITPMYIAMLVLLVIYLFKTLTITKAAEEEVTEKKSIRQRGIDFIKQKARTLGFILILIGYLLLMPRIGFVVSTTLYIAVATTWLGNRKIIQILLVSVLSAIIIYFLFTKLFMVRLPSGLLF